MVLCATLSFVAFKYFFVEPIYSFTIEDAEDGVRLLIFVAKWSVLRTLGACAILGILTQLLLMR